MREQTGVDTPEKGTSKSRGHRKALPSRSKGGDSAWLKGSIKTPSHNPARYDLRDRPHENPWPLVNDNTLIPSKPVKENIDISGYFDDGGFEEDEAGKVLAGRIVRYNARVSEAAIAQHAIVMPNFKG